MARIITGFVRSTERIWMLLFEEPWTEGDEGDLYWFEPWDIWPYQATDWTDLVYEGW